MVKNTIINENIPIENGIPLTSKKDMQMHGFGLKSIIQTAEKYNGSYKYKTADGYYIAEVVLKNCPFTGL